LQPVLERVFKAAESTGDAMRGIRMHLALLEYLSEVLALAQRAPVLALSKVMLNVLEYIHTNMESELPVEVLARESGLSVPRFKARFRSETGFPPAEFVLRRRIERASQLLATGERTVLEVAMQVGFCSSQYFASAFRRITGLTPTGYRKRLAEGGFHV
jgi:transcriptional regulator GlxA family with amidase domain